METTRFYAIRSLAFPGENPPGTLAGFDLDGVVTPADEASDPAAYAMGCGQPDQRSPPPEAAAGIDNRLAPIISSLAGSFDLRGDAIERIRFGELLLLLELTGVEGTTDDSLGVAFLDGRRDLVSPLAVCAEDTPCAGAPETEVCGAGTCEIIPLADGEGAVLPGQTLDVAAASFCPDRRARGYTRGTIAGGRVEAGPFTVQLPIPFGADTLDLFIRDAQLRASVTADGLELGVLGGRVNVDELRAAFRSIRALDWAWGILDAVLGEQADLDADALGVCRSISVALVFDAVSAVRGETR